MASLLSERVSPAVVGAVLGHADPKTTARYVHIDTASLARDPRLHLNFAAPAGKVTAFPRGAGPGNEMATDDDDATGTDSK
jgi:hypothetical protein